MKCLKICHKNCCRKKSIQDEVVDEDDIKVVVHHDIWEDEVHLIYQGYCCV